MLGLPLALLAGCLGQAANEPRFVGHSAEGPLVAAPLRKLAADFAVQLGDAKVVGDRLVALRRDGAALPTDTALPFVVLANGERLPLASAARLLLEDEQFRAPLAPPIRTEPETLTLPQATLHAICLAPPTGIDDVDLWLNQLDGESRKRDLVLLKNGDRVEGSIQKLDAEAGCRINLGEQSATFPLNRIALIAFNPEFQARPKTNKPHARIALRSGARFRANSLVLEDGSLRCASAMAGKFTIPVDELVSLQMRQGKAIYLDDLKPTTYEATAFLDLSWPLAAGRTQFGRSLRLGGDRFESGLSLHSRSRATYALGATDRWFEAIVGIDAFAGPRGAARIQVEVDGRAIPETAKLVKAGEMPVVLRVDLRGGKTLSLIVDFGPLGDVQSHTIWADARIIRD